MLRKGQEKQYCIQTAVETVLTEMERAPKAAASMEIFRVGGRGPCQ